MEVSVPSADQSNMQPGFLQLVELFGSTRDAWMADDLDDWLAANEIYEGVPAIVQHLRSQGLFYIVTTKQVRILSLTNS